MVEHAQGQALASKGQASEAAARFQAALAFWSDYPEAKASLAHVTEKSP